MKDFSNRASRKGLVVIMESEEKKINVDSNAENATLKSPKHLTKETVDVRRLAYLAILSALVFVAQIIAIPVGGFFETSALPMAVIVIGAALLGTRAGGVLGLVFSIAVICLPGTQVYLTFGSNKVLSVFCTVLVVFLKGILAGVGAGFVYKLLEKFNRYVAVLLSGAAAVTVNTGIFIVGSVLFFDATFAALMTATLLISYLLELGTTIILAPAVLRIISIKKSVKK